MALARHLGDHLLGDDIEHASGGEAKGPGHNALDAQGEEKPSKGGDGFDGPGEDAEEEGFSAGAGLRFDGQGDDRPFRNVPIPMARSKAPISIESGFWLAKATPKAMPTDSPSGTLWIVTAKNIFEVFPILLAGIPSSFFSMAWKWGTILSIPQRKPAPRRREVAATAKEGMYPTSVSKAGLMREKKEAESITPAANPLKTLPRRGEIFLFPKKNTENAPKAVQRKINEMPMSGVVILSIFKISSEVNFY